MDESERIFSAKSSNLVGTMVNLSGGHAGFRVPEYQRTYDWKRSNIFRLFETCLNGFHRLTDLRNHTPYTFLGAIILTNETSESGFEGSTYSLVDGQQRLSSLILMCCSLSEKILGFKDSIISLDLPNYLETWLDTESNYVSHQLYRCVIGRLEYFGDNVFFPRIVRSEDSRGQMEEYKSGIATFLMAFDKHCKQIQSHKNSFKPNEVLDKNTENGRLIDNYNYFRDFSNFVCSEQHKFDFGSLNINQVEQSKFCYAEYRNLFKSLNTDSGREQKEINRISDRIADDSNLEGIVRTLLFSSYLLQYIVLTRVETGDEHAAFEIFDALNTTGEPLTALETLKPLIIKHVTDKNKHSYSGSAFELAFKSIENRLNKEFRSTEKRQSETKNLITSFALYYEGTKLSEELNDQRSYLRSSFIRVSVDSN